MIFDILALMFIVLFFILMIKGNELINLIKLDLRSFVPRNPFVPHLYISLSVLFGISSIIISIRGVYMSWYISLIVCIIMFFVVGIIAGNRACEKYRAIFKEILENPKFELEEEDKYFILKKLSQSNGDLLIKDPDIQLNRKNRINEVSELISAKKGLKKDK